jgi:hypothetical protein
MHAKPMPKSSSWVVATPLLAILGLVTTSGCGDGKLETYPVTGTVKVDSKPADGAMVIFCPTTGTEELMKMRPFGYAGPDGKFEVTTFDKADGLPAGDYKVLIRWAAGAQGDTRAFSADRLRGKYMNLDKTPFTAKIDSSTAELPPFELQSK